MKKFALAPRAVLIGLALGAAGFAGSAFAQQRATPTAPVQQPGGGSPQQPGIGTPQQPGNPFVNPANQGNQGNFIFDPRFGQGTNQQGFNQQGFNQFNQGFGNGFFDPFFGAGFYPGWGAPVTTTPNYFPNGLPTTPGVTPPAPSGLPTLGMNVRPGTYDSRRTRVDLSTIYGPGAEVEADQRVRGPNRQGQRMARRNANVTTGSAADPEQGNRVGGGRNAGTGGDTGGTMANRVDPLVQGQLEKVMAGQPLTAARVLSVGPAQAELQFTIDGATWKSTVPLARIFVQGANGELQLGAEQPQMVVVGSQVMAPAPRQERVAGSRQTTTKKARTNKK